MKKILLMFLSLILLFQTVAYGVVWAVEGESEPTPRLGTPKDHPFLGGGTESDPFLVSEKAHLDYIASEVNICNEYYMYSYYRLTNDIDLRGETLTPIGTSSAPLCGTFDGDGYKISNFKIRGSYTNSGLFGVSIGVVQNLVVENADISGTVKNCAAVVALNNGVVSNCRATMIINVSNSNTEMCVGGVVGKNLSAGRVFFCCAEDARDADGRAVGNEITLYSTTIYSNTPVSCGGLVGKNVGIVSTGYSGIEVNATAPKMYNNYIGGLVGCNECEIIECYSYGSVSMSGTHYAHAGGLVGFNSADGTIENCFATGTVNVFAVDMMSGCLAAGLVATDKSYGMYNCYRSRTQYVHVDHNDPYSMGGKVVKNGTVEDNISFCDSSFRTDDLKWNPKNWTDEFLAYPKLLEMEAAKKRYTLERVYGTTSNIFGYPGANLLGDALSSYDSETGTLIIEIPDDGSSALQPGSYNRVEINNCTLRSFTNLALVRSDHGSNIAAVHCDGIDVIANEAIFSENSPDPVEVRVYPKAGFTHSRYELVNRENRVFYTSTDGVFTIIPHDFDKNDEIYIRPYDMLGNPLAKIKTQIGFVEDVSVDDIMGRFHLGLGIPDYVVPKDVPILGGKKIDLVSKNTNFGFVVEPNRMLLALGYNLDGNDRAEEMDKTDYDDYKKGVANLKKNLSNLKNVKGFNAGFNESWGIDVLGYVEIPRDSRGYVHFNGIESHVLLLVRGEIEHQWQTQIGVVPVVLKFSVGAKGSVHISLQYTQNQGIRFTGEVELNAPIIRGSAGVGVAQALDLSIYGSVTNNLTVSFSPFRLISKLKGEIGLSSTLFGWGADMPLIKDEVELYDTADHPERVEDYVDGGGGGGSPFSLKSVQEQLLSEEAYTLSRGEGDYNAYMAGVPAVAAAGTVFNTVFYNGNGYKTVYLNDGSAVSVWIDDIDSRTDYNHTALVWSKRDGSTGLWSVPSIVDDDGTADYYPELMTDGENVYVAWSDSNKVFISEPSFAEVASSQEIAFAVLEKDGSAFGDVVSVTNDGYYDYGARLMLLEDEVYLAWIKNAGNDALTLSGTNTVSYTKLSDTSSVEAVSRLEKPVLEMVLGVMDGQPFAAYVADEDADLFTDGHRLYAVTLSDGTVADLGEGVYGKMLYANTDSGDILFVSKGGDLVCYTALSEQAASYVLEGVYADGLAFVDNGTKDAIIFVSSVMEEDGKGNAYVSFLEEGGLSAPALLVSAEGKIKNISAKTVDGGFAVSYSDNVGYLADSAVKHYTNLCYTDVMIKADLAVDNVYCESDTENIGTVNVYADVKNSGLCDISGVAVTVYDDNGIAIYTENIVLPLACGENGELSFDLIIPGSLKSMATYSLNCVPFEAESVSDKMYDFTLGESDISVDVSRVTVGNNSCAVLTVTNNGIIADYPKVYLYSDTAEGELLYTEHLGKIAPGESARFVMSPEFFESLGSEGVQYYVNAVGEREEYFTEDNDLCFIVEKGFDETRYDINSDGNVNVLDLIAMKKYVSSANEENYEYLYDLNDDGFADSLDTDILLDFVIGN